MQSPNNPLRARAKELGLVMKEGRERIPSSRRAHEATEYARSKGKQDAFHHAVLRRYWTDGEDLHDWSTLRAAALEAQLDPDKLQEEVSDGQWKAAVEAFLREASQQQVNSVPTFILNDHYAVPGAQNATTFRQIFKKLGASPL
jgi:predicted DsbA family dithiol-disulfide isomerase